MVKLLILELQDKFRLLFHSNEATVFRLNVVQHKEIRVVRQPIHEQTAN